MDVNRDYNIHTNLSFQIVKGEYIMDIVTVNALCKCYEAFTLDNVSFQLTRGRIAGFIGRNGAGKTTTIKSMLNLVHADSGEVTFFDLTFKDNERAIKERIGYAGGTVNFYRKKKLKDIAEITKNFYSSWNQEAYEKYKTLFQLDDNKTPSELSEGMKVKFNLLLALSHHAEVLILDEPTSGLDPFSRDELLEILMYLRKQGVAILFSTHIISDIEKCADDIIYISKGKIVAACTMDEFRRDMCRAGETVEQAMLRMERSDFDETAVQ